MGAPLHRTKMHKGTTLTLLNQEGAEHYLVSVGAPVISLPSLTKMAGVEKIYHLYDTVLDYLQSNSGTSGCVDILCFPSVTIRQMASQRGPF